MLPRVFFALLIPVLLTIDTVAETPFDRWEKEITKIESRQKEETIKPGGIVFAGSSSIRLWDLDESFPNLDAVNSGFGGSQIRECTQFAPRIIVPHKPSMIVFYAGDNDVNAKRTPDQVREDFQAFAKTIHESLPKCRILYITIKPSLKRWDQRPTQTKANEMVRDLCDQDERLTYIDIGPPMLGEDGKPQPELFAKDGLHLSKEGYEVWAKALRPYLDPKAGSSGK